MSGLRSEQGWDEALGHGGDHKRSEAGSGDVAVSAGGAGSGDVAVSAGGAGAGDHGRHRATTEVGCVRGGSAAGASVVAGETRAGP